MNRNKQISPRSTTRLLAMALLLAAAFSGIAAAQPAAVGGGSNVAPSAQPGPGAAQAASPFENMIRTFQENYRLGPADEIALRVKGEPQYSIEKTKVTPTGSIYHVLLGDVQVIGMTLDQAREHLTKELREYLKDPIVTISLLEAVSAKFAVFGDVAHSGVYAMARPMNVLDAIGAAGGFAITGSQDNVEVIRQLADGSVQTKRVNVKLILKGKAKADENIALQPGDLVVVHGNFTKTLGKITAIAGFGSLTSFITLGSR
ncbi:MAG: polysaccharide biosynthesis/export family protein [Blastocatellia bacterium]|nr:polysaccharide biosynthesis/export family protein [Blastocatellia bacterium]